MTTATRISPFYLTQLEARLETYEKLSHEWKARGYDVSGKVTVILENQRRHLDFLDESGSKHPISHNVARAGIYDDIIRAFDSEDPRWEPVASTNDALYTPEGKRRHIRCQMFSIYPIPGRSSYNYDTSTPVIAPPAPADTYQDFVKNLFRNCEGRLLGVLTPVTAVMDYPEMYRENLVAIIAGVWVYR